MEEPIQLRVLAGTSGFAYPAWRGSFYPPRLAAEEMLAFYSRQLPAVEINNTFYRLPRRDLLERWRGAVPADFAFALKASRRITHERRLVGVAEALSYLVDSAGSLGPQLGPILFQLPPNLKKDAPRLAAFLELLPPSVRAAFEFRHPSWSDGEVHGLLRDAGAAWCVADTDEEAGTVVATASWGYLRLRRQSYGDDDLRRWLAAIAEPGWNEAFVFFKHEDEGAGPALARRLLEMAGQAAERNGRGTSREEG